MFHKRKEHCIFGKGFVRFSLAPPSSQCFFSHSRRPGRTNLLGCFPVSPHPTTHTTHTPHKTTAAATAAAAHGARERR